MLNDGIGGQSLSQPWNLLAIVFNSASDNRDWNTGLLVGRITLKSTNNGDLVGNAADIKHVIDARVEKSVVNSGITDSCWRVRVENFRCKRKAESQVA